MTGQMPRGATPARRNELAAAEPYRPENGAEIFGPSGEFPTPNYEIAAARPYRAGLAVPESFIAWPIEMALAGYEQLSPSWAEEAFAKACTEPRVLIPADVVRFAARQCGSSNFAAFLQTQGFQMNGQAYLNGPFNSVDWMDAGALNGAIAQVGPVKIGVASASFVVGSRGRVTPGRSGWAIYGLPAGAPENHCASLCGYGSLAALTGLFERHGVKVNVPAGMPAGLCYAMFTEGSIGIIDQQSLLNITGEAWVRNPTTIVKKLSG